MASMLCWTTSSTWTQACWTTRISGCQTGPTCSRLSLRILFPVQGLWWMYSMYDILSLHTLSMPRLFFVGTMHLSNLIALSLTVLLTVIWFQFNLCSPRLDYLHHSAALIGSRSHLSTSVFIQVYSLLKSLTAFTTTTTTISLPPPSTTPSHTSHTSPTLHQCASAGCTFIK